MRLLLVKKDGIAEVIQIDERTVEENLMECLCIELDSMLKEPVIQSEIVDNIDLIFYSCMYVDSEKTPLNEYCHRVLPDNALGDVVFGDAAVAAMGKCYGNYQLMDFEDEQIEILCEKMGVTLQERSREGAEFYE